MTWRGFNTQPPEGGWGRRRGGARRRGVSTHSRLKAAGVYGFDDGQGFFGFNTQPPEGGWAAEAKQRELIAVSTHSRLKAAGP